MKVMIGTALKQAIHNGMANRNIADMVKLPNVLQQEMRVLDLEEQNALEDICLKSNDLAAFGIYLSLNTGMRLGEVLGLTWENIDLKKGIISVKQTLNRLMVFNKATKTEIEIGTPKSKTSRREIPLFNDCRIKLMEYKKRQDEHIKKLNGAYENLGFVFTTPLGKYIEPKTFQDLFKRQIKAAGIKDANFHAMRHTFATRSLEAGMDIYVLSRILGHAQASTTLNKYGHALPDHKKSSMDKLEQYRKKTS
jgi:integrase